MIFPSFWVGTEYMHRSQSAHASRLTSQVYLTPEGEEVGGVWRCTPVKACSKRLHTLSNTDARMHTETCRVVKHSPADSGRRGGLQRHIGRSPGICSRRWPRRHTAANVTPDRVSSRGSTFSSSARADFAESEQTV